MKENIEIKTLIFRTDKHDKKYDLFKKEDVLEFDNTKNKIIFYELQDKIDILLNDEEKGKLKFPYKIIDYLRTNRVLTPVIKELKEINPDVFLIGQTKMAESYVSSLSNNQLLMIRYSGFKPTEKGHAYYSPKPGVDLIGSQYAKSAEDVGFHLTIPKVPELALAFLGNPVIMRAISAKDRFSLEKEILEFNNYLEEKITPTGIINRLWG